MSVEAAVITLAARMPSRPVTATGLRRSPRVIVVSGIAAITVPMA